MEVRVEASAGTHRVLLPSGESFRVDARSLPPSLARGGDARLVVVPIGEAAEERVSRRLLNELLSPGVGPDREVRGQ